MNMKKFTLFAMLLCSVSLMAEVPAYLSDGALVRLGENFMEENIIHIGDVPELEQGTMVYDPVNHVLTLYGVIIHTSASDYGLAVSCANMPEGSREMEVRLIGENYIYAEKTGIMGGLTFGEGTFTVTGPDGSLYVTTNQGNGMFLMCNELTIKDGAYIYAGYETGGLKTRIGIGHFAEPVPVLNIDCGHLDAFGTDYCLMGLDPVLSDAEVDGEYKYDESKLCWVDGSNNIVKDMVLSFLPTKHIFFIVNSDPDGGTVTATKDGEPLPDLWRYTEEEAGNTTIQLTVTPNEGWKLASLDGAEGAYMTDSETPTCVLSQGYSYGALIAQFVRKEAVTPSKPWYMLCNLYDKMYVFNNPGSSPETLIENLTTANLTKTEVRCSAFANGRLYYIDKTDDTHTAFRSAVIDFSEHTFSDVQTLFDPQDTYQDFFALTYNVQEDCFYAVAKKNDSDNKQYLLQIDTDGNISNKGAVSGSKVTYSRGLVTLAADRNGNLYGIYCASNAEQFNVNSPWRLGSMLCRVSGGTAAITPVGWTGMFFESQGCDMAFDYKTNQLIAVTHSGYDASIVSLDAATGKATRLQLSTFYSNGLFQQLPETKTVNVASESFDKGFASLDNGLLSAKVFVGDEFTIVAAPATKEYRFKQWSDGNTDNPRTITLTDETPLNYQAQFDWAEDLQFYPVVAGGVQMNTYKTVLNSGNCPSISTGSISFDPQTGTLTLNKLSLDDASSEYALEIGDKENRMEINMVLEGDNHINAYNTAVVRLNNLKMNITGNTLTINTYYTATGIYLDNTDLTLYAVKNVEINANGFGFYSNEHSTLTFLGTNCDLTGLGGAIEGGWDAVELKHCSIKSPADAKFNEEKGRLEDSNGDAIKSKVVIAADPEVRGTAVEEGTGDIVLTSESDEFGNVGWFDLGTEVTLTAVPADGYVFARWMDDKNWTDEEKRIGAERTITTKSDGETYTALFYYVPASSAYWYAANGNNFVKFSMSDNAAAVERATAPSAKNVKTGELLSDSWYYLDGTAVKVLEFNGITDGEPIDDSSLATLVTGVSGMQDMAFNFRNSVMYATAADKLYAVDIEEEQLAEVGSYEYDGKTVSGMTGIAINGAGVIYLLESGNPSGTLYTVGNIDAKEKKVTLELVGETGQLGVEVPAAAQSIAFDHVTGELFWGAADYMRILDTGTAEARICGDLGRTGGKQGALKAMHRMDRMVSVKAEVAKDCDGMGSVSVKDGEDGSARVFIGAKATVTAKPNSGYEFSYWTKKGDDTKAGTDSELTFTVKSGVTYVAHFEKAAGIGEVSADTAGGVQKLLVGGTLYILRDGRIYTPAGQLVK